MYSTAATEQRSAYTISIAEARRISGLSRTELYRRLAAGKFDAVKCGSRTLVVFDSLIRHLQALPPASFRAPPPKAVITDSRRHEALRRAKPPKSGGSS